tara:strand:- start:9381 stop:10307 length:927 start_codon:yes stop_codon:yes gene_type:complete
MLALGIDIGGTNTKLGLVDSSGKLFLHEKFPTHADQPIEVFLDHLCSVYDSLFSKIDKRVLGAGIGAPNINPFTGLIEKAVNLSWQNVNLKSLIEAKLGLPCFIDNDANIAAIGEKQWGGAQGLHDFIVITLGTGLGTGIFSQGKLLHSYLGMAGEGGHMIVEPSGRPCPCGGRGHLESYVSVRGIKTTLKEMVGKDYSFATILELYQEKDKNVLEAVSMMARYLALGISQMQSLLLPEKIILSGGVSNLGEDFLLQVTSNLDDYSYGPFRGKTKIDLTQISLHDGAILGAAALYWQKQAETKSPLLE